MACTPWIRAAAAALLVAGCTPTADTPPPVADASADGPGDVEPPRAADGAPPLDAAAPDAAPPDAAAIDGGPDARPADHPLPAVPADGPAPTWTVEVLERFPHDPRAFTQGLALVDGVLYESTGLNGQSSVRIVDLDSGAVQRRHDLDARFFGEGLAPVGDALIQLTWRSQVAFVYDRATLAPRGERRYVGEGWGLTFDGRWLILSDGTSRLRFFDPGTFAEQGAVAVLDGGRPLQRLNELEFVDGEVLANVWMTDVIVRIDPASGRVIGRLDLSGLRPAEVGREDVLNGIAWDADRRRLLVTGKRWPYIFSIRARP